MSRVDPRGGALPRPSAGGAEASNANPRGCPFLVADVGGWRLASPARDHRCGAVSPAPPLALEKQSRLCLTPGHVKCATYLASASARAERIGAAPVRRATRWGLSRTTTVIEDPGGLRARFLAAVLDRWRWPALPAVILVTTLFVLALSGFRAGVAIGPVATASPAAAAASVVESAAGTAHPGPSLAPQQSAVGTVVSMARPPTPQATAVPSRSFRTYAVRAGDTLGEIAIRFETTVSAVARLNSISDPARLAIGQVLLIP